MIPTQHLTLYYQPQPPDSVQNRDLFMEAVDALRAEGLRVIAYMACQGPAMLKHGAERAHDAVNTNGVWTSVAMQNWETHVYGEYNIADFADEREMYKTAFAEIIVDEYAQRYGSKIDGWWFDNGAASMNAPLLHSVVTAVNPNTVVTFNGSNENIDYTSGHPNILVGDNGTIITDFSNQTKLLFPIEATEEGFFQKFWR